MGQRISFSRMRDFAHRTVYSTIFVFSLSFSVLRIAHTQDSLADFDAKYVERRGSSQRCAFWQKQNVTFRPPISPKTATLRTNFDGIFENFRQKTALALDMLTCM